ncbi:neutral zinc metallopeptidase [soil metagenome]
MRWQGGERGGGGVEDRRGMGGGVAAGGGLVGIVLAAAGYLFFGIDPSTTQQVVSQFGALGAQQQGQTGTPQDQAGQFVDVVGGNINAVWNSKLNNYTDPKVVIYTEGTQTGCGFGQAAMGPFYCPSDSTVYIDLAFWQEMETQLGASGADFAKAYVIAHEFGHHVQTLTGASQQAEEGQQNARGSAAGNRYSVALELQADCYAGVWAANAASVGNGQVAVEAGDIEEGLKTASAIGDDTLQERAGGRVSPESFTHGSSAQRVEWLQRGYQSGDPASCDTFADL